MEMVHFIPPGQRRKALLAAQSDPAPVLISGASGTGKGAITRWIHEHSPRSGQVLHSARAERTLTAEFRDTQGGTLVISEVGHLSLSDQALLLRILNTRTVTDENGVPQLLNVRVIATTSQALEGRALTHLFNPDLLEKLNAFRIEMPPLSKRAEEFTDIVNGLLSEMIRELQQDHVFGIETEALEALRAYDWPGNLRELRNVLRAALLATPAERIRRTDLPQFGREHINFRATRAEFEKILKNGISIDRESTSP
jgi:DNA-binding NtrC family response regulator